MKTTTRFAAALLAFSGSLGALAAGDWPGFRGARGGASDDKNVPESVSKDNILWKVKLPGAGTSSPIVTGDRILLTANAGYGTAITKGFSGGKGGGKGGFGKGGFGKSEPEPEQKKLKLLVVCLDRKNGALLWAANGRFDVLLTVDRNIAFQQNLEGLQIAVVAMVAKSNRFRDLRPLMPDVREALLDAKPGAVLRVGA